VVVSADSTAFVMLACGRLDPDEMIESGRISWSGDEEWGENTARRLRFTI
jgi:predicted lipid carrier protein YhbT